VGNLMKMKTGFHHRIFGFFESKKKMLPPEASAWRRDLRKIQDTMEATCPENFGRGEVRGEFDHAFVSTDL
jgi:hypothetical protein